MEVATIKDFLFFASSAYFWQAMNSKILLVAVLLAIPMAASQAWDESGHLLIDTLAARKLQPEVVKKMDALLPLLDTRFNGGHPYNLVTAGLWLDDMRGLGKANPWSRWHYVDIPCAGDRAYTVPPPPHALWALDQATEALRSQSAAPRIRAEALAQIMHLVGDIHQPLHVATRNDRGGNDVPIIPLAASSGVGPSNLHAFWDAACRYDVRAGEITELWEHPHRPQALDEPGAITEQARALRDRMSAENLLPTDHPWQQWAYATHMIACQSGWPKEWVESDKKTPVQLTSAFVHASHEIALNQIALAAERLAALLNKLLGEEEVKTDRSPTPPAPFVR